ncbi:MAG: hypothetical protein R3A80_03935 [Bdellovibrionota bacterium]
MKRRNIFKQTISTFLTIAFLSTSSLASAKLPAWSYDPGPNLKSPDEYERKMARELVDLTARIANAPEISEQIAGRQRFRPAYGPIPWRMLQKPNSVKILFIGQDGTHIAEAANRPATAGFGGRAQDLAAYFGVNEGAAFINTYAFTINGQYSTANTPYIDQSGTSNKVYNTTFIDNKFWLVSQDQESPVAQWRSDLIDWIIRNNKDSLQLIVAFGGAAKDGISSFVISRKGAALGRYDSKKKKLQVAETKTVSAGGNNQFSVLLDDNDRDIFQKIADKRAREEGAPTGRLDYADQGVQKSVLSDLKSNLDQYLPEMVFTKGGEFQNGILDVAQLGGYDMEKLSVAGEETISLKGIELNKDVLTGEPVVIDRDILVVQLPHPTALSMMSPDDASATVKSRLKILKPYVDNGWKIPADDDLVNSFAAGEDYKYARSDIGPEYYDFGTPASRMVSVSSASRMSGRGNSHIIVFGSRDRGSFDRAKLTAMTDAQPAEAFDPSKDFFTTRPRSPELRDVYDPGPNVLNADSTVKINFAKIMKENLDFTEIYRLKDGTEWDKENRSHQKLPISNFNIKTHPMIADFGHYRGTFNSPQVVILADPQGYDDMVTSRALTGERGQYLQGFMKDLGVPENYLVLKTVPFGMDGATDEEWAEVLTETAKYRKAIFNELLSADQKPLLVLTDGKFADQEIKSLVAQSGVPVVSIQRDDADPASGLEKAFAEITNTRRPLLQVPAGTRASLARANIPRSHLPYYSRIWEGTSGDCVLASGGALSGIAFAEVAPKWAWSQDFALTRAEKTQVKKLVKKLEDGNLPLPKEKLKDFLGRMPDLNPRLN